MTGAHVLVHGQCGALLALMAARAGAGTVTLIEHCPLSYHASALLLAGNRDVAGAANIHLEPAPLAACRAASGAHGTLDGPQGKSEDFEDHGPTGGGGSSAHRSGSSSGSSAAAGAVPHAHFIAAGKPADLIITDLFDHSVLGAGVVPFLCAAVAQGLVAPGARVLPEVVHVTGQVASEGWVRMVRGCDMSAVNAAHWYPGPQPVDPRNQ